MTNHKGIKVKIVSYVLIAIIIVLGFRAINLLLSDNPSRLSNAWSVGNVWVRILGCSLGILLILLFVVLIAKVYGLYGEKFRYFMSGALILNAAVILPILLLIYSGAARLDSEFTITSIIPYEEEGTYTEHVFEDDLYAASFNITMFADFIFIQLSVTNKKSAEIVYDDISYTVISPDGEMHYGKVVTDEEDAKVFSSEGTLKGNFRIYIPIEKGMYDITVVFSYYDEAGEIHRISGNRSYKY